jgi:hypothetical protein
MCELLYPFGCTSGNSILNQSRLAQLDIRSPFLHPPETSNIDDPTFSEIDAYDAVLSIF